MATKKQEQIEFQILRPKIEVMKVKIRGTSPLLFHKWSEKAIKMMLDKQMKKASKGHDAKDPEQDYRESYYYNDKGQVAFPTRNIKQAIVGSARFIPGVPMTILRGTIFVWGAIPEPGKQGNKESMVPVLVNGKPVTTKDVEKNKKEWMQQDMVRVGMGTADIRFRGKIPEWTMEPFIEFDADLISAEQVLNLLNRAGFSQGLGEWRAERNGDNGAFEVSTTGK